MSPEFFQEIYDVVPEGTVIRLPIGQVPDLTGVHMERRVRVQLGVRGITEVEIVFP